jgi:hypothetical protein
MRLPTVPRLRAVKRMDRRQRQPWENERGIRDPLAIILTNGNDGVIFVMFRFDFVGKIERGF